MYGKQYEKLIPTVKNSQSNLYFMAKFDNMLNVLLARWLVSKR
jgi:hypothetical protein